MYDVWCMMYDVWCMMYDVWCMMYDVWCMMYDVWCMMYDVWDRASGIIEVVSFANAQTTSENSHKFRLKVLYSS